jgi:hypothetical protein
MTAKIGNLPNFKRRFTATPLENKQFYRLPYLALLLCSGFHALLYEIDALKLSMSFEIETRSQ